MTLELHIPDSIPLDPTTTLHFRYFLQAVVNRCCVGALRYGDRPRAKQQYLHRLRKEIHTYHTTGNFEHLLNAAVYCFLESEAPQNKRFHFDATVDNVTRKEFGGNIA